MRVIAADILPYSQQTTLLSQCFMRTVFESLLLRQKPVYRGRMSSFVCGPERMMESGNFR